MVLTPSTMLPLGTALPQFHLADLHGTTWNSQELPAQPLLVLFLCAHCPFVRHIEPEITRLQHDFEGSLQLLAIASNSLITHPQDGPEQLAAQAARNGWTFPYLLDPTQAVARQFHAACTPDLFLFDRHHQLVYRGQLDGSRPGQHQPPDGRDLRAALAALATGTAIDPEQRPSIGCNIKWHPGQEPTW